MSARGVAVLILIVVALAGTLPALQNLWMQQREYHALLRQVESVRTENENLRAEINRWSDRDYVASQARARLHYVRPGETQYVVVDPPPGSQEDPLTQPARPDGPLRPWYMIVADTVTSADTEPSTSDPGDAGSTPTSNPTDIGLTDSSSTDDTE